MDFMVGCAHLRCFVARVRLRLKEPVLFFIIFFPRKGGGNWALLALPRTQAAKALPAADPKLSTRVLSSRPWALPSPDLPREPNEALLVNRAASCPRAPLRCRLLTCRSWKCAVPKKKKTHARALEQENNLGAVPALTPAAPDCKQLGGLEAAPAAAVSPAPAPRLAFCVFGLRAERRNGIRPSKDGVYWKQMWLQGPKGILGGGFCTSRSQPCRSPPSLYINACHGPKFGAKTSRSSSNPPRSG